jgi:hypothetical protein
MMATTMSSGIINVALVELIRRAKELFYRQKYIKK